MGMDRADFAHLRVLLLGDKTHLVQTLRSVLSLAGINKLVHTDNPRRALHLLTVETFDAVFADDHCELIDDQTFATAVRRYPGVLYRMVPVFVFQERARR